MRTMSRSRYHGLLWSLLRFPQSCARRPRVGRRVEAARVSTQCARFISSMPLRVITGAPSPGLSHTDVLAVIIAFGRLVAVKDDAADKRSKVRPQDGITSAVLIPARSRVPIDGSNGVCMCRSDPSSKPTQSRRSGFSPLSRQASAELPV
jgi:hypothetical protein